MNKLTLPELPYDYKALEPWMSETVLRLHHDKHHQSYVDGANKITDKLEAARANNTEADFKALAKEMSFHLSGHVLHTLFWSTLQAARENNMPSGKLLEVINRDFGSFDRFKTEFNQTAISVEGSGWAVVNVCPHSASLVISQVEKHNLNNLPGFEPIMALDVWEHSYYLDYQNLRAKFVEGYWNNVNWEKVAELYEVESGKKLES
jgi:Fe-Mn family superoxide dismutase